MLGERAAGCMGPVQGAHFLDRNSTSLDTRCDLLRGAISEWLVKISLKTLESNAKRRCSTASHEHKPSLLTCWSVRDSMNLAARVDSGDSRPASSELSFTGFKFCLFLFGFSGCSRSGFGFFFVPAKFFKLLVQRR